MASRNPMTAPGSDSKGLIPSVADEGIRIQGERHLGPGPDQRHHSPHREPVGDTDLQPEGEDEPGLIHVGLTHPQIHPVGALPHGLRQLASRSTRSGRIWLPRAVLVRSRPSSSTLSVPSDVRP